MRRCVLLCFLLAAAPATAAPLGDSLYPGLVEFDEALDLYVAGELERARTGFRHLAELGDPEARLNLGVMLVKGEGGPVDRIEGAAWIRWAEEGGLEQAAGIREIVERGLEADRLEEITARLAALRTHDGSTAAGADAEHDANGLAEAAADAEADADTGNRRTCPELQTERKAPRYPKDALLDWHTGAVHIIFVVDSDGVIGGVHSLYGIRDRDPFVAAARATVTQWHANACHGSYYREGLQIIEFLLSEAEDEAPSKARREEAASLLAAARNGDPVTRFGVALLADTYPELFELPPGETEALVLGAAVQRLPEARYKLEDSRWRVLAARQGYGPALTSLSRRNDLPVAERKEALLVAARAGYEPAVVKAVSLLATHPDAGERDGTLALELTNGFRRGKLQEDVLLAQARAMALAETGQFSDAVRLQERVVKTLRRSNRPTTLAQARLAAYEAGEAWRDSQLAEEFAESAGSSAL